MNWVPYIKKFDEEFQSIKESGKLNYYSVRSLIFSAILFPLSFFGLGIDTNPSSWIGIVLFFVIKIVVFLIGGWGHYLNFYILGLQIKLKKSVSIIPVYLLAILSLGYFLWTAYFAFCNLIQQI